MGTIARIIATIGILSLAVVTSASIAGGPATSRAAVTATKPCIFNQPYINAYYVWWRPYWVTYDLPRVREIFEKLGNAEVAGKGAVLDLEKVLGHNRDSSFTFPVMASLGEGSVSTLDSMLRQYNQLRKPDDQWLLVIATLGRIPSPRSERIILTEMDRRFPRGKQTVDPDLARPLIEAYIACLVAGAGVSYERVHALCDQFQDQTGFIWTAALEWTFVVDPSRVASLLNDAMEHCSDEQLKDFLYDSRPDSTLVAISRFLSGVRSHWPVARDLLLTDHHRDAVRAYARFVYLLTLQSQADADTGDYALDPKCGKRILSDDVDLGSSGATVAAILLNCRADKPDDSWTKFLKAAATHLPPKSAGMVQYMSDRIHLQNKPPEIAHVHDASRNPYESMESLKKPGVYMRGFEGIAAKVRAQCPQQNRKVKCRSGRTDHDAIGGCRGRSIGTRIHQEGERRIQGSDRRDGENVPLLADRTHEARKVMQQAYDAAVSETDIRVATGSLARAIRAEHREFTRRCPLYQSMNR